MLNKYLLAALVWAIVILALTLTPGESVPDVSLFDYDKLGHGFVFFVLAFLLTTGFYQAHEKEVKRKNTLYVGTTIAAVYGFVIEIIQSFIPGRSMEAYDAIANIVGSFLGLTLFYIRNKLKHR